MTATRPRLSRAHLPGTRDSTTYRIAGTDLVVHQTKQFGQRREWYLLAPHSSDSARWLAQQQLHGDQARFPTRQAALRALSAAAAITPPPATAAAR